MQRTTYRSLSRYPTSTSPVRFRISRKIASAVSASEKESSKSIARLLSPWGFCANPSSTCNAFIKPVKAPPVDLLALPDNPKSPPKFVTAVTTPSANTPRSRRLSTQRWQPKNAPIRSACPASAESGNINKCRQVDSPQSRSKSPNACPASADGSTIRAFPPDLCQAAWSEVASGPVP